MQPRLALSLQMSGDEGFVFDVEMAADLSLAETFREA